MNIREVLKRNPPTSEDWDNSTQAWADALWEIEVDDMAEDQLIEVYARLRAQGRLGR